MPVNILLPLDGSAFSEHAYPAALELARQLGAKLHLVHVHEPPVPLPSDGSPLVEAELSESLRGQEEEYLRALAGRCMETAGVATRTELLEGPVATALASYIHEIEIDLVVMSTHGRSGISRAWVGSVADAVVRRAAVPVLLLRPHDHHAPEPLACRHVLVPLDGSALAEGILAPLELLCRVFSPRFTLLRVVPPLQIETGGTGPAVLTQSPAAVERAAAAAHEYLETVAATWRAAGASVDTAVQVHGIPAVAILDYAGTHSVDLVAMATHGRGGWSRVALGSVADKVMRGTLMPVLLYRPPAAVPHGHGAPEPRDLPVRRPPPEH
ncbi:MAG: universal stress protein [Gemmatimonadetes bacterium]|nr:universal stress protein [Gemmatimonadota bacterium]